MPDFEVLFRKVESGHTGAANKYYPGDVIRIRDWPNNGWGLKDDPTNSANNFYSGVVTGVPSLADLEELILEVEDAGGLVRRRNKKIDVQLMPNNVRNRLQRDGTITGTWAQVQAYVADRL